MKLFVLTPAAEQDISGIWDYIASESVDAAERVLDAIETSLHRLVRTPKIGHLREELADQRHRFSWSIPT